MNLKKDAFMIVIGLPMRVRDAADGRLLGDRGAAARNYFSHAHRSVSTPR